MKGTALIQKLEQDTQDPLDPVRCQLELLYEDSQVRSTEMLPVLQATEAAYKEELGHRAEFWLLLAVGHRLVAPYPVYGNPSSSYYGRADGCQDLDTVMYLTLKRSYADYLIDQLETRAQRSPARMNRAKADDYSLAAARLRFSHERQAVTS